MLWKSGHLSLNHILSEERAVRDLEIEDGETCRYWIMAQVGLARNALSESPTLRPQEKTWKVCLYRGKVRDHQN